MYNQIEAVLSQYELEIHQTKKGRGTQLFDTSVGPKVLVPFRGSKEKGEFLQMYLAQLYENGFEVEQICKNKNEEVVSEDGVSGERYILKDYIKGVEMDTARIEELVSAIEVLAEYHLIAQKISGKLSEMKSLETETQRKHYRELIRVKNYIRGRKKKNAFDQMFLNAYDQMITSAEEAVLLLEQQEGQGMYGICHGEFNQHNILKTENGWRMVNFENFRYGWLILDLANFLRKMLEKNEWSIELGTTLLTSYSKVRVLEEVELKQLYGLLLFPEKFWKISNHYMNSRKSWLSERDIEKLKIVMEQEAKRKNFIQNVFSFS